MIDPSKPASLYLYLPTTLVLALCAALVILTSCGTPAASTPPGISPSPPDASPADALPTPTTARPAATAVTPSPTTERTAPTTVPPSPTTDAKATIPAQEEPMDFTGLWADDQGFTLELGASGVYTQSRGSREPDTGTWSLQEDGSLRLEGQSSVLVPHGNVLLLDGGDAPFILGILQRVAADGTLLPYEPASPIEVPPMDAASILNITITDDWTGLSPLAPIEARFRLAPASGDYSGTAEFSVAGYTEAMTRTVPISVPYAVIDKLLALLQSTPVETGAYKRVFSHTDDFPRITIAVEHSAGEIEFSSESQGSRHIPWRVVVGADHYVTYADTPVQALDLLDPYLARDVQEALFDLAQARDQ